MNRTAPAAWALLGGGVVAAVIFAAGSVKQPASEPAAEVKTVAPIEADLLNLGAPEMARSGIRVATLAAGSASEMQTGFARGLDVGALAAIDAESQSARAAANASRAEVARLQALYAADQSASLRSVEAARAQASIDSARADLATRRVGLEYGPGLMQLGPGGIRQLVSDVATGRAALVRIDVPDAMPQPGQAVQLGEGARAVSVRVIGPAAAADAKLQSAGVLAIVRGPLAGNLLAGRLVTASLATAQSEAGVIVPRSAVVRWQGGSWVYRQAATKGFERVELIEPRATDAGWFVAKGLSAGQRIAVTGAGSLLAIERGGEAGGEEE